MFSAQILGFSADFHRKSVDIVKQHPNNARIWAESLFCLSYQGPTLVRYGSTKIGSWEMEKTKEILTFQNVAKTGNIGEKKKSSGRLYRLPSNSFVPLTGLQIIFQAIGYFTP